MLRLLLLPLRFVKALVRGVLLAVGQISAHKVRSILTTAGIVIGIASTTAVVAGITGLKTKVLDDFAIFGAARIWAFPRWPDSGPYKRASWQKIQFREEQFEGFEEHCPTMDVFCRYSWSGGTVKYGRESVENVTVIGFDPSWHESNGREVIDGQSFSLMDREGRKQVCLLTEDLRDKLGLNTNCVGQSVLLGGRRFHIVGIVEPMPSFEIFSEGGRERDELFIPFETARRRLGRYFSMVDGLAASPETVGDAIIEIKFFLRRTRRIAPGDPDTFQVEAIKRFLDIFNQVAAVITAVAGAIVSVSLLVGGVGIMNIMLVSVSERTREIGLRKAVGARPSAICLQFLIEAVVLCLLGGLLGVAGGHLLTMGMAAIPNAQLDKAYIPGWAILLSFGLSAAVGLFFGIFPAIKAARLDPIEALRHE